ncbi:MAG: FAD/FMN-containing dehydrogenase, partial [Flavobacteriaceae bacterium]
MNIETLKKVFKGTIRLDSKTLEEFSTDASLFQIIPGGVVSPRDTADIQELVKWVNEEKEKGHD